MLPSHELAAKARRPIISRATEKSVVQWLALLRLTVSSPLRDPILDHNLPHIRIPLPLDHSPYYLATNTRMPTPYLLRLLPHISQIRRQKPRSYTLYLDPISLQLVIPIHYQYVQRHLAASVSDYFEVELLGIPRGERGCGEIVLGGFCDIGEASYEDQAGIWRFEKEGHKGVG